MNETVLHCTGCYAPEICPGIHYGKLAPLHCEGCVLDDDICHVSPYPKAGEVPQEPDVAAAARADRPASRTVFSFVTTAGSSLYAIVFVSTEVISKVTNGGSLL